MANLRKGYSNYAYGEYRYVTTSQQIEILKEACKEKNITYCDDLQELIAIPHIILTSAEYVRKFYLKKLDNLQNVIVAQTKVGSLL